MKKILIIDDEKSFLDIFSTFLKKYNFETYFFIDPQEALIRLPEIKPDAIILDIAMPKLNGFSVLSNIKRDFPNLKVIFLTNITNLQTGEELTEELVKSLGADGLIRKTADLEEIVKKIKEYLTE